MKLIPFDYAARNLGRRTMRLFMTLGGAALVALLVLAAAAFVNGMEKSLRISGAGKNVLLIGAGSEESLERSEIGNNVASIAAASISGIKTEMGDAVHIAGSATRFDRKNFAQRYANHSGVVPRRDSGGISGPSAGVSHRGWPSAGTRQS